MTVLSKDDRVAAGIFASTSWLSKNRPHLDKYLKDAMVMGQEKDAIIHTSVAVNGPHGYEYFTFEVNLESEQVTLKSEGK